MSTATFVLIALALTLLLGAGFSVYVWKVRRKQLEITAGIDALAAMRWREFSHFVVEALQAQGFEMGGDTPSTPRGEQAADLALVRDGGTWLVTCKQGANYRINQAQVRELSDSVRFNGAAGGILATLGRIQPEARKDNRGIELVDGVTLWGLVEPLLPPSLTDHLAQKARQEAMRNMTLAWLLAAVLAGVLAVLLRVMLGGPEARTDVVDAAPGTATPTPPAPPAPEAVEAVPAVAADNEALDEATARKALAADLASVEGVANAVWSTRSTLVVVLEVANSEGRIERICRVLARYPDLRASRLQLQPPAASEEPVRFMQCHSF
ncbi:MAG: restriction endonuclease [Pseudomonadota bacterium]|nr:restriction endonuclease [Pseudomonadota bacterium]